MPKIPRTLVCLKAHVNCNLCNRLSLVVMAKKNSALCRCIKCRGADVAGWITFAVHPLKLVILMIRRSLRDRIGFSSQSRWHWTLLGSSKLPSGPTGQASDITIFSRKGSIGGFVTCANNWTDFYNCKSNASLKYDLALVVITFAGYTQL